MHHFSQVHRSDGACESGLCAKWAVPKLPREGVQHRQIRRTRGIVEDRGFNHDIREASQSPLPSWKQDQDASKQTAAGVRNRHHPLVHGQSILPTMVSLRM